MKKSTGVLALLVALAAVYTGASWYVGQQTETAIREQVNQANEYLLQQGEQAKLELSSYERSLFSSSARYVLSFNVPDEPETFELVFADRIAHGPIPFAAGYYAPAMAVSHIELQNNDTVAPWFALTDGKVPVYADTHISWAGKASSVVEWVPFKKNQEERNIDFSGGQILVDVDRKAQQYSGRFSFDHFLLDSVSDQPIKMTLKALHGDFDYSGQLYVNDKQSGKMTLEKVDVQAEDGAFGLKNFVITAASETVDSFIKGTARYDIESLEIGEQDVGKLEAAFDFDRWYAPAFLQANDLLTQLSAETDLAELSTEDKDRLAQALHLFLEHKPSINFSPISWKNAAGETNLGLQIALQAPEDKTADLHRNVLPWVQALDLVHLDVHLSRPMIEQVLQKIAQSDSDFDLQSAMLGVESLFNELAETLEPMGMVKRTSDGLESRISYSQANGEVIDFNGTPVPISDLFMLGLGLMM